MSFFSQTKMEQLGTTERLLYFLQLIGEQVNKNCGVDHKNKRQPDGVWGKRKMFVYTALLSLRQTTRCLCFRSGICRGGVGGGGGSKMKARAKVVCRVES